MICQRNQKYHSRDKIIFLCGVDEQKCLLGGPKRIEENLESSAQQCKNFPICFEQSPIASMSFLYLSKFDGKFFLL